MLFQFTRHTFLGGLATSLFISLASPSIAFEKDIFAKDLAEIYSKSTGVVVEYGEVSSIDDQVTIHNFDIPLFPNSLSFGKIIFNGVSETGNGGYKVEKIRFEDAAIQTINNNIGFNLKDIEVTDFKIPDRDTQNATYIFYIYDKASIGSFIVNIHGVDIANFSDIEIDLDHDQAYQNISSSVSVNNLNLDLSSLPRPKADQDTPILGYDSISGDIRVKAHINMDNGLFDLSETLITLNDFGRFNFTMKMSGFTRDFQRRFLEKEQEFLKNKNPGIKFQQAYEAETLNMMREIKLHEVSTRFDDASFTSRILKLTGARHGLSGEQMAERTKRILPMLFFHNLAPPELENQVIDAASNYLDDHQNIEINVMAHEPVSFGELFDTAQINPKNIFDFLDIKVTANQ